MLNVLVEGWIKYPHSYSVVNIYQLIALARKPYIKLYLEEKPPYREEWPVYDDLTGLLITKEEQDILNAIERWDDNKCRKKDLDVVYRITYPYNVSLPTRDVPVSVFYTAEFQLLQDIHFEGGSCKKFVERCFDRQLFPVTPSHWSANALIKHKYAPIIIPHGVDISKYFPFQKEERMESRKNFRDQCGLTEDAFIFLSVGAMTGNKNVIGMIKAWYRLTFLVDNVVLVLKGIGDLYACQRNINDAVNNLKKTGVIDKKHFSNVKNRLVYIDEFYGYERLCELYNSVDCYLSPYIAEGFNIPVLEAIACGLPIVTSKGGATDDFTTDEFTRYPKTLTCNTEKGEKVLIVDDTSLQETMISVIKDIEFRKNSFIAGPKHVSDKFTWDIVADKLFYFLHYLVPDINLNKTNMRHPSPLCMP